MINTRIDTFLFFSKIYYSNINKRGKGNANYQGQQFRQFCKIILKKRTTYTVL